MGSYLPSQPRLCDECEAGRRPLCTNCMRQATNFISLCKREIGNQRTTMTWKLLTFAILLLVVGMIWMT